MARTCGKKGRCGLHGGMCYVGGGGDGSCRWQNTVSAGMHLYIHPIILTSVLSIFDFTGVLIACVLHPCNYGQMLLYFHVNLAFHPQL